MLISHPRGENATSGVRIFQSYQPDEIIDYVGKNLAPHRMSLKSTSAVSAQLKSLPISTALIVDIRYGAAVCIDPEELVNYHLIHASISGCSAATHNDMSYEMRPDNLSITSPGYPVRIHMTEECRHLAVRVPEIVLERYLATALRISVKHPIRFDPTVHSGSELPVMWRGLLSHLMMQSSLAPDTMSNPRIQLSYLDVMTELLLLHYRHNYSDIIKRCSNEVLPRHVRRARELIHDTLEDCLSITEIARKVGVSTRSLQNGFKQFLGITPAEYIRQRRLEELHHLLCNLEANTSITDIMLRCGIINFGRYAQYYKMKYGCLPSQTLRKSLS